MFRSAPVVRFEPWERDLRRAYSLVGCGPSALRETCLIRRRPAGWRARSSLRKGLSGAGAVQGWGAHNGRHGRRASGSENRSTCVAQRIAGESTPIRHAVLPASIQAIRTDVLASDGQLLGTGPCPAAPDSSR